jgi:universal stress protein E
MPTILMATDLSTRSDRAFERAVMLARLHKTELNVVHIVDEALPDRIGLHQKEDAEESIRNKIASLQTCEAPTIVAEVKNGKARIDIVKHANEKQADLIIIGVRNILYECAFRGTTCEEIIRMGDLPVLVVRDGPTDQYKRALVAVDFSLHSRRAIELVLSLAPEAEIHLVHAYEVPFTISSNWTDKRPEVEKKKQEQMEQMIEEEMAGLCHTLQPGSDRLHQVLRHGHVRHVLKDEVERLKPDLLVLGTHGRTGIARAFLGSVAEAVLGDPPCDALAVKAW